MSRASQFIDFINTDDLRSKGDVRYYKKHKLTGFKITEEIMSKKRFYLQNAVSERFIDVSVELYG